MGIELVEKEECVDSKEEIIEENKKLQNGEKIPTWKRQGFGSRKEWADHNAQLEGFRSEAEKYKIKRWEQGRTPIEIASTGGGKGFKLETYLSQIYGKLEPAPYGNPKYDFICKRDGKKIEVKRRELVANTGGSCFDFTHIDNNDEADIFILVGLIDDSPKKFWKFNKDDILPDELPFHSRDRLIITYKPQYLDLYEKFELPIRLEELEVLYQNKNEETKKLTIDNIICREIKHI